MKVSLKYMLIVIFLFFPLLPFSNPTYLHYFMSFRNISCSTFTIWCNKSNRHFTVIDTLTLSATLQILIGLYDLLQFCYFLTIHFIHSVIFLSPPSGPHTTTYIILDYLEHLIPFPNLPF